MPLATKRVDVLAVHDNRVEMQVGPAHITFGLNKSGNAVELMRIPSMRLQKNIFYKAQAQARAILLERKECAAKKET